MAGDWYTPTGAPVSNSEAESATIRAEFEDIETALDKLPALTGNGSKPIAINAGESGIEAVTASGFLALLATAGAIPFGALNLSGSGTLSFTGGMNSTPIGQSTAADGAFTTLTASTSLTLASGETVVAILDEDNFVSDSSTALATQQSIKAYVDSSTSGAGTVGTSGTPAANDFARFTNATTIEGRSYSEVRSDLGLVVGTNVQAEISGASLTSATVSGTDKILGQDADDSNNLKTFTAQSIADLASVATKAFTATGSFSAGDAGALMSDGTVEPVAISTGTESIGTVTDYDATATAWAGCTFDSANGKVVIANEDGSTGQAIVGTVSGTSISFGSPAEFVSGACSFIRAAYDEASGKVVVVYRDEGNSNYGTAIVGTVSGTSISFGTAVVFESASTAHIDICYDKNSQKVVVAYKDTVNSGYGTSIVGTVSGTSISFGTPVVFESASTEDIAMDYDSTNGKIIISYKDVGNSNYGTSIVGTVSGTSISFGSAVVWESTTVNNNSMAFSVKHGKCLNVWRDGSGDVQMIVGTVSGTSITFGTKVELYNDAGTAYVSSVGADDYSGKFVVAMKTDAGGKYEVVALSGTAPSGEGESALGGAPATTSATSDMVFDSSNNKIVYVFEDTGSSNSGVSVVIAPAFDVTNNDKFIGFATEAIFDTNSGDFTILGGVNANQSGLTAGADYYLNRDGSLTTSSAASNGDSLPRVASALSSTEALILALR